MTHTIYRLPVVPIMEKLGEILAIPEAVFVVKLFIAICLIVFAIYGVLKLRDFAAGTMPKNGEYVTEFENMRDSGLIDDKELGQLKSAVGKASDDLVDKKADNGFDG
ncbi:MAG: hypothetical protein VX438_01320 [Planctomycetota bacterium]|nr:hypothetical protein [Planctomycetota bacterium]